MILIYIFLITGEAEPPFTSMMMIFILFSEILIRIFCQISHWVYQHSDLISDFKMNRFYISLLNIMFDVDILLLSTSW